MQSTVDRTLATCVIAVPIKSKLNYATAGTRRFYYVDRYQVKHFRQRGPQRWFRNPCTVFVVVVVSSGVLITVYYGNLETIPYTQRKHFVLLSTEKERKIGEAQFQQLKASFKGKILPPLHPYSIRVKLIASDIINALQRGIGHERVWSDISYSNEELTLPSSSSRGSPNIVSALGGEELKVDEQWPRKNEILDDKWVQESRKAGKARGSQPATQHLEGLSWEVIVVDEPVFNATCFPGGKIVVFTGLLNHFRTDAELATIIGHEVGHVIAWHAAERITKNMWFAILHLVLLQFIYMPTVVHAMFQLLLKLPLSRRMEIEADHIGVLLMAAAGYDPRVAPKACEKSGQITGDSSLKDYLAAHPSDKTRAKLLAQSKVTEEALAIYGERLLGHGIEGFL
ncbi:hypothetical protein MRB53_027000 [Persea americana]|uniref:Uncharacterized protein n=1 Tax=Persea americana TaxID=3435 RepID=A0ACC2LJU2_PERAE|nr:hypothetical protein MRB53_027000 [Persea americana]